mmetsp:Transcript_261/g.442  ORF Transcript_261/g.442 Transcript_261/m.442 type:complete len:201 (+) Transcript_261:1984-2586(+)
MGLSKASRAVLLVCGPSGVGKGTICSLLLERFPDRFGFCVSHTTRPLRPGEVDGVSYHTIKQSDMKAAIDDGKFAEFAHVHGEMYGTSFAELQKINDQGRIALLDVDLCGVTSMKASPELDCKCVGIVPPSTEELELRLRSRESETEEQIGIRMRRALQDIEFCDTSSLVDEIVVNTDSWTHGYPRVLQLAQKWWPHHFA